MSGPLAGIRVLDFSSVVLGPFAGLMLGDMGADVTKVESIDGDVMRHAQPSRNEGMGAIFLNLNRNKKSLAINLKSEAARDVVNRLVSQADVVIHSIRPKAAARLGLDYAALSAINPRLVYCAVRGFAPGPYADLPALDDVIQAASGIAHLQGGDGPPRFVSTILVDKTAGLHAASAISMALFERERSGLGQEVVVPMFETMVQFLAMEHLQGLTFDPPEGPSGYARVLSPHRKPYQTRDGQISVIPYTDRQWARFFADAGRPDLATDPRVGSATARSIHVDWLYGTLAAILADRGTDDWLALCRAGDIPAMRVNTLDELMTDEQVEATGLLRHDLHPSEGPLRQVDIPVRFTRTPGSVRRLAPRLGEHTQDILLECGYTTDEVEMLTTSGVCLAAQPRADDVAE
jgi:crotonobetainyl-CoA:carnitine CoA-transferase CaiB-like acyl-CoA transferase